MADNLRKTLSEKKSLIQPADQVIVETDKGTTVSDFGSIIFDKDNFDFSDSIDNATDSLPILSAGIQQQTQDKFNNFVAPEFLTAFYSVHSNSQSDQIGIEGIATTVLPLCSLHVNTINSLASSVSSLPISPNTGDNNALDGNKLLLSPGIYRVECNATFTLIGPPGGVDANGNPYGNGDKAAISLELFKFTDPQQTLLASTPAIDHGLAITNTSPPDSWCLPSIAWVPEEQQIFTNLPSHTCYMYGFVSICNPSYVDLRAHTAGIYVAGYPSPGNVNDLPPTYTNPVQILFEKISDDPFLFNIASPELDTLESVSLAPIVETPPPDITDRVDALAASTYSLSFDRDVVREGNSFIANLETEDLSNGTRVPYIISGVTTKDIDVKSLVGDFIVNDNKASITIKTLPNKTRNTLRIKLIRYPSVEDTIQILPVLIGAKEFTNTTTYNWTVPKGVTEISMVAIGGGGGGAATNDARPNAGNGGDLRWRNFVNVEAGETIRVTVGDGGIARQSNAKRQQNAGTNGGDTIIEVRRKGKYIPLLKAAGGRAGTVNTARRNGANSGSTDKSIKNVGGGNGGLGGVGGVQKKATGGGGGGGAGGYSGNGGNGGDYAGNPGGAGAGGGGGGGEGGRFDGGAGGGGGGVGLYGEGDNGQRGIETSSKNGQRGGAGSKENQGQSVTDIGGEYGGGGGAKGEFMGSRSRVVGVNGGQGAARIIWGADKGKIRSFPNNARKLKDDE